LFFGTVLTTPGRSAYLCSILAPARDVLKPYLDARLTRDERAAVLKIIKRRIDDACPPLI